MQIQSLEDKNGGHIGGHRPEFLGGAHSYLADPHLTPGRVLTFHL